MTLGKRDRKKLAESAIQLAAQSPWRDISLADIAAAAEIPLAKLYGGGGKLAVLTEIEALLDQEAAKDAKAVERTQSPRDRLFEAAMRRFDAMETRRAGLLAIDAEAAKSPSQMAIAAALSLRTARWLMTVAGVEPNGPIGAVEFGAMVGVLRSARAAWREDSHGDLSRTMSTLDRGLRDIESRFSRFKSKKASSGDAPPPEAQAEGHPS
ncbi:MAG: TetR family transcriptional regulator [Caulobacterales bacterium]